MVHRGTGPSRRFHPAAPVAAALALFAYVVIGLSPLWVPAVERAGIPVCTATGMRIVPAGAAGSAVPEGERTPNWKCPLCTIQGAFLLPPVDVAVDGHADGRADFARPVAAPDIAGLFTGFDHLSRAPPVLA